MKANIKINEVYIIWNHIILIEKDYDLIKEKKLKEGLKDNQDEDQRIFLRLLYLDFRINNWFKNLKPKRIV